MDAKTLAAHALFNQTLREAPCHPALAVVWDVHLGAILVLATLKSMKETWPQRHKAQQLSTSHHDLQHP